jgi:Zn-dependent protease
VSEISAWQEIREGFDFSYVLSILLSVIPSLVCITLHELSHGTVAYALGDDTAKRAGRLTLNPLKHLDLMGLVMMVVAHVGWAKPVPVNMMNFKDPKRGMAVTSLAGPVSNVLITCFFFFLYGVLFVPLSASGSAAAEYLLDMVQLTAVISAGYAVFNLIPIPPLDGSKVLFSLVSDRAYYQLMRYERYGMLLLYALVFTNVLGGPLRTAISFLTGKLFIFAQWGFAVFNLLNG